MNDLHILELEAYATPQVYEDPNDKYVSIGDSNDWYSELIDVYLNSPTSHAIITGVVNQVVGKGLSATNSNIKPNEYAQMMQLFKKQDLKKISLDYILLGEAAIQITYNNKKVASVSHFNRETLRAEKCDVKGKINAYYYHPKWAEYKKSDNLTRIPVFGSSYSGNEIYIIRRHVPSMHYYSVPSYIGALNYGKLECEISQYLVNEVNNSFSGSKLVSFSNGIPTLEKQQMIKAQIQDNLTGANGQKVIVSFTDSPENKTTIEDISVSDAADVYSYISEECTKKLLLAHRITSPLLVGIRDSGGGLGSNSEEIQNAHNLFENLVIKPFQNDIIDAVEDILAINDIALKVYIQTLTPIEFIDTQNIVTKEEREEETGQKLSSDKPVMTDSDFKAILKELHNYGEDLSEEWELVEESDAESYQAETQLSKLNLFDDNFDNTADASKKSTLDKGLYKLRYGYAGNPNPEREFCKEMISRNTGTKHGYLLYRKEDIDKLSELAPNPGLAESGSTTGKYSLFDHVGGKNCKHYWKRLIFFRKRENGKFQPNSVTDDLENDKRVGNVPGLKPKGDGQIAPNDRDNKGAKN